VIDLWLELQSIFTPLQMRAFRLKRCKN